MGIGINQNNSSIDKKDYKGEIENILLDLEEIKKQLELGHVVVALGIHANSVASIKKFLETGSR